MILIRADTKKQKENVYIIHGMARKKGASPDRALHTCGST